MKYRCRCCDNSILPVNSKRIIDYVCPVCYWENDVHIQDENTPSENNRNLTLKEARENYKRIGRCDDKLQYKCRCCGNLTLPIKPEEAVGYICPICWWENDVFTPDENEPSDCNRSLTLKEARVNYERMGRCDDKLVLMSEYYQKSGQRN